MASPSRASAMELNQRRASEGTARGEGHRHQHEQHTPSKPRTRVSLGSAAPSSYYFCGLPKTPLSAALSTRKKKMARMDTTYEEEESPTMEHTGDISAVFANTSRLSIGTNSSSSSDGDLLNKSVLSDTTDLSVANLVLTTTSKQQFRQFQSLKKAPPTTDKKEVPSESNNQENASVTNFEVLTQYSAVKQSKNDNSEEEREPLKSLNGNDGLPAVNEASASTPIVNKAVEASTPNTSKGGQKPIPSSSRAFVRAPSPSLRDRINASPSSARKLTQSLRKARLARENRKLVDMPPKRADFGASPKSRRSSFGIVNETISVAHLRPRRNSIGTMSAPLTPPSEEANSSNTDGSTVNDSSTHSDSNASFTSALEQTHSSTAEESKDSVSRLSTSTDISKGDLDDLFDGIIESQNDESNAESLVSGKDSPHGSAASMSRSSLSSPPASRERRFSLTPKSHKKLTPTKLAHYSPRRIANPASLDSPAKNTRSAHKFNHTNNNMDKSTTSPSNAIMPGSQSSRIMYSAKESESEQHSRGKANVSSPSNAMTGSSPSSPSLSKTSRESTFHLTPNSHKKLTPTKLARSPRRIANPASLDSPARNTRGALKASKSPTPSMRSLARSTRSLHTCKDTSVEGDDSVPSHDEMSDTVDSSMINDIFNDLHAGVSTANIAAESANKRDSYSVSSKMVKEIVGGVKDGSAEADVASTWTRDEKRASESLANDSIQNEEEMSVAAASNARKPAKRRRSSLLTFPLSEDDTMSSNVSALTFDTALLAFDANDKNAPNEGTQPLSPVSELRRGTPKIVLSSALKRKSTTGTGEESKRRNLAPRRTVAFGSPQAAEYHVESPSASLTPMPKGQAKAMFAIPNNQSNNGDSKLSPSSRDSSNDSLVADGENTVEIENDISALLKNVTSGKSISSPNPTEKQPHNDSEMLETSNGSNASVEKSTDAAISAFGEHSEDGVEKNLSALLKNVTDSTPISHPPEKPGLVDSDSREASNQNDVANEQSVGTSSSISNEDSAEIEGNLSTLLRNVINTTRAANPIQKKALLPHGDSESPDTGSHNDLSSEESIGATSTSRLGTVDTQGDHEGRVSYGGQRTISPNITHGGDMPKAEMSLASSVASRTVTGDLEDATVELEVNMGGLLANTYSSPTLSATGSAEYDNSNNTNTDTVSASMSPADSVEMTDVESLKSMNLHINKQPEDETIGASGQKLNFELSADLSQRRSEGGDARQENVPTPNGLDSSDSPSLTSLITVDQAGVQCRQEEEETAKLEEDLGTLLATVGPGRDSPPLEKIDTSLDPSTSRTPLDKQGQENSESKSEMDGKEAPLRDSRSSTSPYAGSGDIFGVPSRKEDTTVELEPRLGSLLKTEEPNSESPASEDMSHAQDQSRDRLPLGEPVHQGTDENPTPTKELEPNAVTLLQATAKNDQVLVENLAVSGNSHRSGNDKSGNPNTPSRESFSIAPKRRLSLWMDGSVVVDSSLAGDDETQLNEDLIASRQETHDTVKLASPQTVVGHESAKVDITCGEFKAWVSMKSEAKPDSVFRFSDVRCDFGGRFIAEAANEFLLAACNEIEGKSESCADAEFLLQSVTETYPDEMLHLQEDLRSNKPESVIVKDQLDSLSKAAQASVSHEWTSWETSVMDVMGNTIGALVTEVEDDDSAIERNTALVHDTHEIIAQMSGASVRKARRRSMNRRKTEALKIEEEIRNLQALIEESKISLEATKKKKTSAEGMKDALVALTKSEGDKCSAQKMAESRKIDHTNLDGMHSWTPIMVSEQEASYAFPCFSTRTCVVVTFSLSDPGRIPCRVKLDPTCFQQRKWKNRITTNFTASTSSFVNIYLNSFLECVRQSTLRSTSDMKRLLQQLDWDIGRLEMKAKELDALLRRYAASLVAAPSSSKARFLVSVEFKRQQDSAKLQARFELFDSYPFTPLNVSLDIVGESVDVDALRKRLIKNAKPGFGYLSRTCDVIAAFVS